MRSTSTNGNTLTAGFDAAGDRTSITYFDGYVVNYVYDYLQRPHQVCAPDCPANPLAAYFYDDLGRLTSITRHSGANTTYTYAGPNLIHTLAQSFTGTSADVTWTYAYDPANGLISRAASNDAYSSHPGVLSHSYTTNGLDRRWRDPFRLTQSRGATVSTSQSMNTLTRGESWRLRG